jgi:hypothetical protein
VFNELASSVDAFKGMTYRRLGTKGLLLKQRETVPATA